MVNDATPSIAFSPNSLTLTKDTLMTTATPSSTGGAVLSWSITPTLPSGLSFDTSTELYAGRQLRFPHPPLTLLLLSTVVGRIRLPSPS